MLTNSKGASVIYAFQCQAMSAWLGLSVWSESRQVTKSYLAQVRRRQPVHDPLSKRTLLARLESSANRSYAVAVALHLRLCHLHTAGLLA